MAPLTARAGVAKAAALASSARGRVGTGPGLMTRFNHIARQALLAPPQTMCAATMLSEWPAADEHAPFLPKGEL